jgi:hypothetical protein
MTELKGGYVKVPEVWLYTLDKYSSSLADWKIAMELLRLAKFRPMFKFINPAAAKLNVSPRTRLRSLSRLERWGLILLKRRAGAALWVRPLHLAGKQPLHGG